MKQVSSSSLRFLDVITSERFANGMRWPGLHEEKPIEVGLKEPSTVHDASDPSRGQAKFLVLSVGLAGLTEAFGGPDDTWTQVQAQRLNDDGTYNKDGEVIVFKADSRYDAIYDVTLVGRMNLAFTPEE
jgi:hypothetical protein